MTSASAPRTPGATRVLWTRALRRLRQLVSGAAPDSSNKDQR